MRHFIFIIIFLIMLLSSCLNGGKTISTTLSFDKDTVLKQKVGPDFSYKNGQYHTYYLGVGKSYSDFRITVGVDDKNTMKKGYTFIKDPYDYTEPIDYNDTSAVDTTQRHSDYFVISYAQMMRVIELTLDISMERYKIGKILSVNFRLDDMGEVSNEISNEYFKHYKTSDKHIGAKFENIVTNGTFVKSLDGIMRKKGLRRDTLYVIDAGMFVINNEEYGKSPKWLNCGQVYIEYKYENKANK